MKHCRTSITLARQTLVAMIEQHSATTGMTFYSSADVILRKPALFNLMLQACGNWFKGRIPGRTVISRWRNPHKLATAKRWPDLTPEEFAYALPYLTAEQRYKSRPSVPDLRKAEAVELLAQGKTRREIHAATGIQISTLYRWFPVTTET